MICITNQEIKKYNESYNKEDINNNLKIIYKNTDLREVKIVKKDNLIIVFKGEIYKNKGIIQPEQFILRKYLKLNEIEKLFSKLNGV